MNNPIVLGSRFVDYFSSWGLKLEKVLHRMWKNTLHISKHVVAWPFFVTINVCVCVCASRFSKQVVTDQLLVHEMQGVARGLSEAGTNEDFHSFL